MPDKAKSLKNKKLRCFPKEPLVDPAATNNLVGFFALLLEIDKRNNPHLYRVPKSSQSHA